VYSSACDATHPSSDNSQGYGADDNGASVVVEVASAGARRDVAI
jgi:hypothetical protein